ncbi:MAG TPA: ATP-dependent DNA helicase, partial [Propionibacteriaceae bacterium]|nr:ATP-dependent DNA helicase [Propionibacteriaceae bacterium]
DVYKRQQLHRDGVPWSDMAILYRVHAQSPPLEVALGALGIPFRTRDDAGFFQRSEVRQALIGFRQRASTDAEGSLRSHLENVLSGLGWQPDQPRS